MSIFYKIKERRIDQYSLRINTHTMCNGVMIKAEGDVIIEFVNKKFNKCNFPFSGTYSRDDWEVLAEINKKIKEIENSYD